MKTLNIIIPSDNLLFDGFTDAVEAGWENSVSAVIDSYICECFTNPEQLSDIPAVFRYRTEAILAKALSGNRKPLEDKVAVYTKAVLDRRERIKSESASPRDILVDSYAALAEFGFSARACRNMGLYKGNRAYLDAYIKASQERLYVSSAGRAILDMAEKKMAEGYDVNLIRCEQKREAFRNSDGTKRKVMDQETALLHDLSPDLHVTHCGMALIGDKYIGRLPLARRQDGYNVIMLPENSLEKYINSNIYDDITAPLVMEAYLKNILLLSICDDQAPGLEPFDTIIANSDQSLHGATMSIHTACYGVLHDLEDVFDLDREPPTPSEPGL